MEQFDWPQVEQFDWPSGMPDLVGTIDLHIGLPDALDMGSQDDIALSPFAAQCRVALSRGMAAVTRRGNLQNLANRLDPERIPVLIDEVLQDLSLRSSSAWAKKALASERRIRIEFLSSDPWNHHPRQTQN